MNILKPLLLLILFLGASNVSTVFAGPQYGFAHRVNSEEAINLALEDGAVGIEADICWDDGDWHVSHNDFECNCTSCTDINTWLEALQSELADNYDWEDQLVMLWLDVKDAGNDENDTMVKLLNKVRDAGLPSDLQIMYDFGTWDSTSRSWFSAAQNMLTSNEGATFWAENTNEVTDMYNFFKDENFTRGVANHGHSVEIDEDILAKANETRFNLPLDIFRFKRVFTWTNAEEDSMKDYMHPNNAHYTSGQIVGQYHSQWNYKSDTYWDKFVAAVDSFSTEKLATKDDDHWRLNEFTALLNASVL